MYMKIPQMPDVHPECKTPQQWKKALQQYFQDNHQWIQKLNKESKANYHPQIFGAYETRRREVILNYMDKIRKRFLSDKAALHMEQDYIYAEVFGLQSYEDCESQYNFCTAAAIWVLDELKREHKLEEAYQFLPSEGDTEEVEIAEVFDAVHPHVTIKAMTYAIQHRNAGLQQGKEFQYIVDEGTARRQKIDNPFRKIVALLDKRVIDAAVKQFETDVWDWLELFFEADTPYAQKLTDIINEMQRVTKQIAEFYKNLSSTKMMPSPLSALPAFTSIADSILNISADSPMEQLDRLAHLCDKTTDELHAFLYSILIPKVEEYAPDLADFYVSDPFATSFALIWLLDSGSDLPFLYLPGVSVLKSACLGLPWVTERFNQPDVEMFLADTEIHPSVLPIDWAEKARKIYAATGYLLPRNRSLYNLCDKQVGKKLSPAATILQNLAGLQKNALSYRRIQFDIAYPDLRIGQDSGEESGQEAGQTQEETGPEEDIQQEVADTASQVKQLQEELDRLRRQLYEANHAVQAEKRKRENSDAEHETERQELIDLRNFVFSLEHEDEAAVEDDSFKISFPYQVNKRIVVFGGHDSWLKAIKPMLDGVRWVDKEERVIPDTIKNADVVFVQTNAMPHKMFYSIDDYCKKYKTRLRYCCSASAERCALQIAEEDMRGT